MTGFLEKYQGLPPQQRRITYWLIMGLTTKEIAQELHIKARTVSNQLGTIYRSLGVRNRSELIGTYYREQDNDVNARTTNENNSYTGTETESNSIR